MLLEQRYRVCRLLQRDESGRRNTRLANSVLHPLHGVADSIWSRARRKQRVC